MSFIRTVTPEINGRTFTINVLALATARQVWARLQKIIAAFADEESSAGMSAFMLACMAGAISEEDFKFYAEKFGQATQVDMGDGRVLVLTKMEAQQEVFGNSFEDQFEWLDACIKHNYEGVLAKMRAALKEAAEAARLKAEAAKLEAEKQSESQ